MSAKNRYVKFCTDSGLITLPLTEHKLCLFVSHLAESGLKFQTVKCYLSGLRYFQISAGMGDPYSGVSMPRLEYTTKGIKKAERENPSTHALVRLPITQSILLLLKKEWEKGPIRFMIWAACTLAFFGFLRIGEKTVADGSSYDTQVHLSIDDITFDHSSAPTAMFVNIKASKTDPFRKGVTLSQWRI